MPDVRMPDGTIIRNVPQGTTKAELERRYRAGGVRKDKPTSFWQGTAEGILDPAMNAARVVAASNPVLSVMSTIGDLVGSKSAPTPKNVIESTRKAVRSEFKKAPYQGSTAGRVTGGIVGSLPAAFLPGGAIAQGAYSGAMMTEDPDNPVGVARDATIGAITGKIGEVGGRRLIAPVAERVGRTKAAQSVKKATIGTINSVTGRTGKASPVPVLSATDKAVNRMSPEVETVLSKLEGASEMNLPYALADASPELRMLAGSVSRKSPEARSLAEKTFMPRSRGQADRAVNAIDEYLAPITNIEQRAGEIRSAAQTASEPFYTAARAKAAPVDEELAMMLDTPAGKQALREAYTTAANAGRNPQGIGFNLNDQGEVVLQEAPSFETLQLVKRAMDSQLEPARNPITGAINLEGRPDLQAIAGLRERLNSKLGALNEDYQMGNQTYAGIIRQRDALNLGQDVSKGGVPQRQFDAALKRMDETTMPEMQRGYATSMADTVNRQRLSGNPYEAVYGSTDQQAKVGALFPEGAPQFDQLYNLEGDMAKTTTETLGGSPTQPRAIADQLFDENGAAGTALKMVTSPQLAGVDLIRQRLEDQIRTRGSERAAAIAPTLFDTNPELGIEYIKALIERNAGLQARKQFYGQTLGDLFGLSATASAVPALSGSSAR